MTAADFVALIALAWIVLLAAILALFHGAKWLDRVIDEEMNAIAPAPWGQHRRQREE